MRQQGDASAEPVVFDRAAGYYDATRGFPPGVEEGVANLFAAAGGLGPASRVLEIGIGTGRIALPLAKRVGAVAGVDLSRAMLAKLLAKRGALAVAPAVADAATLPFPTACFDAVVGVHVFHLIPRWREVMGETARVLRPGAPLLHGGDDQSGGSTWAVWRRRLVEQFGVENAGVERGRLETFPEEEGWRPAGEPHRLRFSRTIRPREILDRIAQRTWSATWQMDDAKLAEAVATLRSELLAAYGDLERPAAIETGFWVRAYLPPGR
jgi:ubiquinone/menaquinone biosynthesis C-methylase UbiE